MALEAVFSLESFLLRQHHNSTPKTTIQLLAVIYSIYPYKPLIKPPAPAATTTTTTANNNMMYSAVLLSALAALPSLTSAIGVATVRNYCPKQLCVYTTAPGGGPITSTRTVQPNGNTSVNFPANGMVGTQVRVSPTCDPNNAVYWEFAQGNSIIYYDVNINGPTQDPFIVRGLGVTGSTSACPAISCAAGGSTACFNNPNGKPQNQVKACQATNSIFFNACRP